MPKSLMDWLGVVCLWVGAIVLAFKSTDVPLISGAPMIFAAGFWNYVPAVLVSLALGVFVYRQSSPIAEAAPLPIPVGATLPLPQYATKLADPLTALKKARDNAAVAVQQGVMRTRMKALHEVEAAMVTINKEFGIPSLHLNLAHNDMGARVSLEVWVRHIDCFYPLLRAGHVQEAKAKAEKSSANYPSPEKS